MKSHRTIGLLVVALLGAQVRPAAAQGVAELTAPAVEALADRHFELAERGGGAAVVAVVKDGQLLFLKGYGLANRKTRTPVDPARTLFRIGSVTKVFTALTALQLIERGVIDPDADVNQYLAKVGVQIHDRFDVPVTMRSLLKLQAGRFDWTYSYYYPLHDDQDAKLPPDEIGRRLWRTARPGDVSDYDNNGVGLIGFVAEAAAGRSYRDLVRSGVLEPLGMTRSVAGLPRDRVPEMAGCSDPDPATAYQSCPYDLIAEHLRPSGGMTTTGSDMARLLIALGNEGRLGETALLSSRGWAEFVDFDDHEIDPRLPAWGQVIYEVFTGGRYAFGHDGGVGAFGATIRIYPHSGIGLFAATQAGLDWERPAFFPKALSELGARPGTEPLAPDSRAFAAGARSFESDFVKTFLPPRVPPGAERADAVAEVPTARLAGRYWRQLAKGQRFLLSRMLLRMEPTVGVKAIGADELLIEMPGDTAGGQPFRRVGVNAFRESTGGRTLVFADSPRGINANWTDGAALSFYRRLPWHYRPGITLYPLPIALLLLLTAFANRIAGRKRLADRRLATAASVGGLLVLLGLAAELEYALTVLYHGGHTVPAVLWRVVLHLGLVALAFAAILPLTTGRALLRSEDGRFRPLKALYVASLAVAAMVTIALTGYWGLIGSFTA